MYGGLIRQFGEFSINDLFGTQVVCVEGNNEFPSVRVWIGNVEHKAGF